MCIIFYLKYVYMLLIKKSNCFFEKRIVNNLWMIQSFDKIVFRRLTVIVYVVLIARTDMLDCY